MPQPVAPSVIDKPYFPIVMRLLRIVAVLIKHYYVLLVCCWRSNLLMYLFIHQNLQKLENITCFLSSKLINALLGDNLRSHWACLCARVHTWISHDNITHECFCITFRLQNVRYFYRYLSSFWTLRSQCGRGQQLWRSSVNFVVSHILSGACVSARMYICVCLVCVCVCVNELHPSLDSGDDWCLLQEINGNINLIR